jgi:hypothetical protein
VKLKNELIICLFNDEPITRFSIKIAAGTECSKISYVYEYGHLAEKYLKAEFVINNMIIERVIPKENLDYVNEEIFKE